MNRTKTYLGPLVDIEASDLKMYENGQHVIESKVDGMWIEITVRDPKNGKPHILNSRDGDTDPVSGSNLGDIHLQPIPLPQGSIIIGELEAATEWSVEQAEHRGFRRVHLFDIHSIPGRFRAYDTPLIERKKMVSNLLNDMKSHREESRFVAVPSETQDFRSFYDWSIDNGYEGVVIKPLKSRYYSSRSDGKTKEWIRCKRWVTMDYVLCGIGKTPGGKYSCPQITGLWGLYKNGQLEEVMQAAPPFSGLLQKENIGKLVCEFKGWAKFRSGALRHAQAVRIRTDKSARSCTL